MRCSAGFATCPDRDGAFARPPLCEGDAVEGPELSTISGRPRGFRPNYKGVLDRRRTSGWI